ncbi:MAG: prepilin-type N-terminal cleavage/methylation domain-containing protein [Bacteroidia bacterium]|nr:prepilin-type N-terminal cleavage/methylation domain-containing protein [Bacteroidia bacterium]
MKTKIKNNQTGFTLIEFIVTLVIAAITAAMVYTFMGSMVTKSSEPITRLKNASTLHLVMENIIADYNRLNALNLRYKWQASTPYRIGAIVTPKTIPAAPNGGHYYKCTAKSGTGTSGATEPSWPTTTGATVIDNSGPNQLTWTESGNTAISIWQASNAYAVGAIVVPINNNGHYYKCTVKAGTGTSGATEPSWPTATPGATVIDNSGTNQLTWTEVGTILDRNTGLTDAILLDSIKYYLDTYLTTNVGRYGTGYTVVATETKFIKFNSSTGGEEDATGTEEKNILKVTIKNNDSAETLTELFTIR